MWTGSLGPEGCRTCLMEPLMLKENRQKSGMALPFLITSLRTVITHFLFRFPYHWLCGFRFVQFIETNHSRFPWKQLLYFHSRSPSSPVGRRPQPVTTSTHAFTESHGGNKCVILILLPNLRDLLEFSSSLWTIIYKLMLSNASL